MSKIGRGSLIYENEVDTLKFDWGKINTLERVRKFGITYFKCASR